MKMTTILAVYIVALATAMGQGTVYLANYDRNVIDAPFFLGDGTLLAGTDYLAQLYDSSVRFYRTVGP